MSERGSDIGYERALAAYQAGQKLHCGGRALLVRRVLREAAGGPVLWITDERMPGEHGLLLFPDGRMEVR